jgi:hypothetical protein
LGVERHTESFYLDLGMARRMALLAARSPKLRRALAAAKEGRHA